jgi:hypothetical protein
MQPARHLPGMNHKRRNMIVLLHDKISRRTRYLITVPRRRIRMEKTAGPAWAPGIEI